MLQSRLCARCWIILLAPAGLLGGPMRVRSQAILECSNKPVYDFSTYVCQ